MTQDVMLSSIRKCEVGITPSGYQHLLDNQAVLAHKLTNLDVTALAAAAARGAAEVKDVAAEVKLNAKLVSSAAELSVQAQPLLHAIQQQTQAVTQLLQQQNHAQNQRLDAIQAMIQANQDTCACAIM